jgi:malic enzyme
MGIPVGKLSLYSACAGVDPKLCLPVMLDVGTNNEELLNDPYYVGLRQQRLRGHEYDALVEEFVSAATSAFPGVVIQFEDFANHAAFPLRKISGSYLHPNDDIQGTAAVALAGIFLRCASPAASSGTRSYSSSAPERLRLGLLISLSRPWSRRACQKPWRGGTIGS